MTAVRSAPSWCGRSPTAPAIVVVQGAFRSRRWWTGSPRCSSADRRAAGRRRDRGRPLRRSGRQRPGVERAGEDSPVRPGGVRRLLRQRGAGAAGHGLAGPRLPGHLAGQRGQPGRRRAGRAPGLPPGLPGRRGGRRLPRARAPPLARAHPPGRGRPLRHAGGVRADALPAVLPALRAGLSGLAAPGVPGVLRGAPRAAAAREGRRRLLQPGALPRRRRQPDDGPAAPDPACCRSRPRSARAMESVDREAVANAVFPVLLRRAARGGVRGVAGERDRRERRGPPLPPTWTATRRWPGWPRRRRRTWCGGRCASGGGRDGCARTCGRRRNAGRAEAGHGTSRRQGRPRERGHPGRGGRGRAGRRPRGVPRWR